ncbi:MAG: chromosomal replication initiator protein DnaA [Sphingomonadales bacterium]|nr:chromosomal replication initiator protein DnaA [Sphingomonadales bacterium]
MGQENRSGTAGGEGAHARAVDSAAAPDSASWKVVAANLRKDLGVRAFDHWLKPVGFGDYCGTTGTLTLHAPTHFSANWIAERYLDRLLLAWKGQCEAVRALRVVANPARETIRPQTLFQSPPADVEESVPLRTLPLPIFDERLTFDHFIAGQSNILARGAAMRMAAADKPEFSPLYLRSATGQGKTHLLHAIGHAHLRANPNANIVMMSAEKFMLEFVAAIRANDMMAMKARLRVADLLMIDDLQFIVGKGASTQDELLHTIDFVMSAGKRLVVAADRSPHMLDGIDPRLLSRLSGGLVADIETPSFELRRAILDHRRETLHRVSVPDDVVDFLARNFTRNIRELEGALNKLVAYASLTGTPLDIDLARDRLAETLRGTRSRITIDDIQKAVCAHYKLDAIEMSSKRRARVVARPRQVAMYLAKTLTPRSYPEIGRKFGGRDHSTVIHAFRTIDAMRQNDPDIDADIVRIRRALEA